MWFPVLYSRSLLFIYFIYSSVYMLIANFWLSLSPSYSPLVTINLFYILSVSVLYISSFVPFFFSLKRPWCWERLKTGGEGDDRGWDDWMASLTQWIWVWVNSRSWPWTGREAWRAAVHGVTKSWTWLSDWTEVYILGSFPLKSLIHPYWSKIQNNNKSSFGN